MANARKRMVPEPSLTMNDVIITSLLLLNIVNAFANLVVLSDTLLFKTFSL